MPLFNQGAPMCFPRKCHSLHKGIMLCSFMISCAYAFVYSWSMSLLSSWIPCLINYSLCHFKIMHPAHTNLINLHSLNYFLALPMLSYSICVNFDKRTL